MATVTVGRVTGVAPTQPRTRTGTGLDAVTLTRGKAATMWCGPGGWSGWWHGGWSPLVLLGLLALAAWMVFRSPRQEGARNRAQTVCGHCGGTVQDAYFRCPECGHALKTHCPACSRVVETGWRFCPYCSEDVNGRTTANPQRKEGGAT